MFFRIGVLAYNVGRLFVLCTLDESWHRHQVQTLRWRLYETAARWFRTGVYLSGGASGYERAVRKGAFEELAVCEHLGFWPLQAVEE